MKEKRHFIRYEKEVDFDIELEDRVCHAKTIDYSVDGLSAMLSCFPSISKGDVLHLSIGGLKIRSAGKVIRVSRLDEGLKLGIQRLGLMHGSLEDFDIADLILGIQRSNKTGVLFFRHEQMQKSLYFEKGDMTFATSNQVFDRMGDMLLRDEVITKQQYLDSSEVVRTTGKRHGSVLIEMGMIKPPELFAAVKRSVENIILSVFSIKEGEYMFKEGPIPTEEVITLKLSAANLIYNGIKKIEDMFTITQMCPALDEVIIVSTDPLNIYQDIVFTADDKKILAAVDGKRMFSQIIEVSGLSEFDAIRSVCALIGTRIIELAQESVSEQEPVTGEDILRQQEEPKQELGEKEIIAKIEQMYTLCTKESFYKVLELEKSFTRSDIKRSYYKMAKAFHPDKHFNIHENMKDKLNTIFTTITTAYTTLTNPSSRDEYDKRPNKSNVLQIDPIERANSKFEDAMILFKSNNYEAAAAPLAEAAYLDSTEPKYHFYNGVAMDKLGKFKEAERAMQRAIKIEPFNADYMAAVGYVYISLKFYNRARTSFEKALKLDALHENAMKGMSELPEDIE
jgi:curved DNA-binding protein CbpA